jgi:hypothetical protein
MLGVQMQIAADGEWQRTGQGIAVELDRLPGVAERGDRADT